MSDVVLCDCVALHKQTIIKTSSSLRKPTAIVTSHVILWAYLAAVVYVSVSQFPQDGVLVWSENFPVRQPSEAKLVEQTPRRRAQTGVDFFTPSVSGATGRRFFRILFLFGLKDPVENSVKMCIIAPGNRIDSLWRESFVIWWRKYRWKFRSFACSSIFSMSLESGAARRRRR